MRLVGAMVAALLVAGCGGEAPREDAGDGGTQISIKGGSGNFAAGVDKDGRVALDLPGFKGAVTLPRIELDAGNFDINGVGLPEGSKVSSIDVNGNGSGPDERVRIAFTSPVGAAAVRDWFQGKLAAEGFRLTANGTDLNGTTETGKPFSLTTRPAGDGRSESVIAIGR